MAFHLASAGPSTGLPAEALLNWSLLAARRQYLASSQLSCAHSCLQQLPQCTRRAVRWVQCTAAAAPALDLDLDQYYTMPTIPLPLPRVYQQTLKASFTLGGVGMHTGEYVYVRVRPALAGEGRYFVRVPEGTLSYEPPKPGLITEEEWRNQSEYQEDAEQEDQQVQLFQEWLAAQEAGTFPGDFTEFTRRLQRSAVHPRDYLADEPVAPRGESEEYVTAHVSSIVDSDDDAQAAARGAEGRQSPGGDQEAALEAELEHGELPERQEDESEEDFVERLEEEKRAADELAFLRSLYQRQRVCTTLARDGLQVQSVEHLLAALEACGIDNARIEVQQGPYTRAQDSSPGVPRGDGRCLELPALDGSALGWALQIWAAGHRPAPSADGQPVPKKVRVPQRPVTLHEGESWISLHPERAFRLTAGVDEAAEAAVIGKQWASWCPHEDEHFRWVLAGARTFLPSQQVEEGMRRVGLLRAGWEDLALVGAEQRWWNAPDERFPGDEPARHKVVDLLGDLALLAEGGHAGWPLGHVMSYQANHELQAKFLRQVLEACGDDWQDASSVGLLGVGQEHNPDE